MSNLPSGWPLSSARSFTARTPLLLRGWAATIPNRGKLDPGYNVRLTAIHTCRSEVSAAAKVLPGICVSAADIGNATPAKFVSFKRYFLRQHHVTRRVDALGHEAKTQYYFVVAIQFMDVVRGARIRDPITATRFPAAYDEPAAFIELAQLIRRQPRSKQFDATAFSLGTLIEVVSSAIHLQLTRSQPQLDARWARAYLARNGKS
jgi:hypothetical protein